MKKSSQLISTAIMKTDIKGFSRKIGILSDMELSKLLQDHKEFIIRSVYKYNGSIIKGEGDAFLISFSSVTSAIESAIDIQNQLAHNRSATDDNSRLSIRIVVTLGDVLHKDNDVFGESVNLISRIEAITPPDEIYLSESAFLTLRKKEINTEYVGEFDFKGSSENSKVYKIILGRKLIVLENQYVLFSDIAKFASARNNHSLIEKVIDYTDIMFNNIDKEHNGIIRGIVGDAYLVTFKKIEDLLSSLNYIYQFWTASYKKYSLLRLRLGAHKGEMLSYRRFCGGTSFNKCAILESSGNYTDEFNINNDIIVTHVSDIIMKDTINIEKLYKKQFRKVSDSELKKFNCPDLLVDRLKARLKSTYIYTPKY